MRFPDTPWTLIRGAGPAQTAAGRLALERVLARYLPVLRAYLMAYRRMNAADADDLLQGFVLGKILEQRLIERADPGRGRFRSLLLAALENYRQSSRRFERAEKRAPAGGHAPIEAAEHVAAADDPSAAFDLGWARHVIDAAADAMRAECTRLDRGAIWTVFAERELRRAAGGEPQDYEALRRRLGLQTTAEAQNLLVTAKRMFRRHVEKIVAEYAADRRDLDAEIRDLMTLAGRLEG